MPDPSDANDIPARVRKLEVRIEQVAADATAARHLAAANDRDYADIAIKVDANRAAINALGVQTAARFDKMETRFDKLETRFGALERKVDTGFAEMRAKLDQTAGALQFIAEAIGRIEEGDQKA